MASKFHEKAFEILFREITKRGGERCSVTCDMTKEADATIVEFTGRDPERSVVVAIVDDPDKYDFVSLRVYPCGASLHQLIKVVSQAVAKEIFEL